MTNSLTLLVATTMWTLEAVKGRCKASESMTCTDGVPMAVLVSNAGFVLPFPWDPMLTLLSVLTYDAFVFPAMKCNENTR